MKTKMILSIVLIIMTLCIVSSTCIAAPATTVNPDSYKPSELTSSELDTPMAKVGKILNAITSIGIVVSVIMVMVLGIRYMIASVEQKAEYKKTAMPMIIGIFILFSVSFIVKTIYNIMSAVNT